MADLCTHTRAHPRKTLRPALLCPNRSFVEHIQMLADTLPSYKHARTHTHTHTAPLQLVEEFVMGDLTEPLMTYELRDLKMGPQVHARVECVIPIPPFEMLCSNRVRHVPNHLFYCFIRTALCSRCRSPSTRIQRPSASGKLGASHTCTRSPGICVSNSVLSLNKASPSSLATTGTVCIRIL